LVKLTDSQKSSLELTLQKKTRSLIEQDSDYWAIYSLSPEIWQQVRENKHEYQWTDLMYGFMTRKLTSTYYLLL
jgi:regulator of extracellular matrix RemA (YlzA/DUF370 family)